MTRRTLQRAAALVMAAGFITLLVAVIVAAARAEPPKYSQEETVLALAQQCVAEVDFDRPHECWLMWHINQDLARRIQARRPDWHLVDQLRAYNSAFRKTKKGRWLLDTPRTAWVRELNLQGDQPPSWKPPHVTLSWPAKVSSWLAIVELAKGFLEAPGPHPCPTANAYGGDCSNPKGACDAVPKCWVRVGCAVKGADKPLAQLYYRGQRCPDEQT